MVGADSACCAWTSAFKRDSANDLLVEIPLFSSLGISDFSNGKYAKMVSLARILSPIATFAVASNGKYTSMREPKRMKP